MPGLHKRDPSLGTEDAEQTRACSSFRQFQQGFVLRDQYLCTGISRNLQKFLIVRILAKRQGEGEALCQVCSVNAVDQRIEFGNGLRARGFVQRQLRIV